MPTTVDKIRRALEKRDGIAEEEMRPLADKYRNEVQQVNQRLDDAVMLLRKGLRSEAIQRVEMTPNALDAAANLEFPEWDDWNEILQFMGVPLPPKLNQDYVAQINEAIIESLPLDALLRRHRRLAIAKAPLSVRLRTLRQIARVDAANHVWQDDVEEWEKIRLSQIDGELKRALEKEDVQALHQLHQELSGGQWRVAPSSRLIEQSAFAAQAHERDSMQTELEKLAPQINQAFEQRDIDTARGLRSQWQSVRARFKVSVPPELEMSVAPAMQWLEDLDRQSVMESERQTAISHLESTLDSQSPMEEVQQAYEQANRFGEPVPEELSQRVTALSSAPAQKAKRKTILIGSGIAAAVLALAVAVALFLNSSGKESDRLATIEQMRQLVAAEQHAEALSYYNVILGTKPEIASAPEMIALKTQSQKAVDSTTARLERFENLISQAKSDDPSLIDSSLLPQLEELAATPGEQARVAELRKRKQEYQAAESMRQSDEMLGKIAELQRTFGQLESRGNADGNRQAMEQLLSKVIRLPKQFPMHSSDSFAKQETLRGKISSTLGEMKDQEMASRQRQDAIDSLANSRSLEQYADRLRDFSTQSVSRTNFIEFRTVIGEEENWLDVDRLNTWLGKLGATLENGVSATEARELIESGQALQSAIDPNPALEAMPAFFESMDDIVDRRLILKTVQDQIRKHPLARLVTLPIDDGGEVTMQYLMYKTFVEQNSDRMDRAGSIGVSVVSDELGGVRNRAFPGPLPQVSEEPMRSVQKLISDNNKLQIDFDQRWEQTFLRQVSELMLRRPELDGVIKELLIYYLLDAATRGSDRLAKMIPQTMRMLSRRNSVRQGWYQPRRKNTDLNPDLEQILKAELAIAYKRFASPLGEFEEVSQRRMQWIGFLAKSAGNDIEYHLRGNLPEHDGTLYVAAPAREGDANTSLLPIGELEQGHITLHPNPVHQVPGRPLFLFQN